MRKWWTKHFDLLIESGLTKKILSDIASKKEFQLRDECEDFFEILLANGVPILIFSASIGNVIEEYLKIHLKKIPSFGKIPSLVRIISNFFAFDEKRKMIGYDPKIIHSYNKDETQLFQNKEYMREIDMRDHVLLLGDSTGDLGMSEGLPHKEIIRIGFLNEDIDGLLKTFEKKFDIIVTDDGSMEYINQLLQKITVNN